MQQYCIFKFIAKMNKTTELLTKKGLSKTPCRSGIIDTLNQSSSALSESDIRSQLSYQYDRVTIYRTLKTFIEKGIIHEIAVEGNDTRYALSHEHSHTKSHYHTHFKCTQCNSVICIGTEVINHPNLPEGFQVKDFELIIKGSCNKCSS